MTLNRHLAWVAKKKRSALPSEPLLLASIGFGLGIYLALIKNYK
jgi:hypothetical protein